jgi:hypothetical protein
MKFHSASGSFAEPSMRRSACAGRSAHSTLVPGLLSAAASLAVLAWRGRADTGSAAAPLNAVSHVLWGDEALRRDDATAEHTLLGATVHAASALFWAGLYAWVHEQRSEPTLANAATDAAALTLLAAVVDFKVVPKRLTPGFERRLTTTSLASVYAALGMGLALGGWWVASRRPDGTT